MSMLIDDAYKVLMLAKAGNTVSVACYNDWVSRNKPMPPFPNPEYDKVNTYTEFYNLAYYYIFGD